MGVVAHVSPKSQDIRHERIFLSTESDTPCSQECFWHSWVHPHSGLVCDYRLDFGIGRAGHAVKTILRLLYVPVRFTECPTRCSSSCFKSAGVPSNPHESWLRRPCCEPLPEDLRPEAGQRGQHKPGAITTILPQERCACNAVMDVMYATRLATVPEVTSCCLIGSGSNASWLCPRRRYC